MNPERVARQEVLTRRVTIPAGLAYLLLIAVHLLVPALVVGGLFLVTYGRLCHLGGWLDGYRQRQGASR